MSAVLSMGSVERPRISAAIKPSHHLHAPALVLQVESWDIMRDGLRQETVIRVGPKRLPALSLTDTGSVSRGHTY